MTPTLDRYERAARAAFEYAYPRGYGKKLNVGWDGLRQIVGEIGDRAEAQRACPTIMPNTARKVLDLYRGIAKAAIEA